MNTDGITIQSLIYGTVTAIAALTLFVVPFLRAKYGAQSVQRK